jgi:hypothetical protein
MCDPSRRHDQRVLTPGRPNFVYVCLMCSLLLGAFVMLFGATAQAQASRTPQVAVGNLPGCLSGSLHDPRPYMQKFHATILRVVVSQGNWHGNAGQALPCVAAAHAEGYKVDLDIEWASSWPTKTVQWFFWRELSLYRYYANAVAVGNEQEIVPPNMSPAKYVQMWRAVEPEIKRAAPWAIRIGGDISPWGFTDLEQELRDGLPGIQAVAVHPYRFSFGYSVGQALALADRYRLPLWCDEGLQDGPDSWPSMSRTIPLSGMRGAVVAGAWDRV